MLKKSISMKKICLALIFFGEFAKLNYTFWLKWNHWRNIFEIQVCRVCSWIKIVQTNYWKFEMIWSWKRKIKTKTFFKTENLSFFSCFTRGFHPEVNKKLSHSLTFSVLKIESFTTFTKWSNNNSFLPEVLNRSWYGMFH